MRALVHDPSAPFGLARTDVAEPVPDPDQALVGVEAVSLNSGEVRYVAEMFAPGEVPGWDSAGIVVQPAADGSGPPEGARVAGFDWRGGWAERRAIPAGELAVVPDGVELAAAATLPCAAVTALRALRPLGDVLGRRVLVTGASGGVGRFAVALAARAGAHVVASVGSVGRGEGLREAGAAEVVVGVEGVDAPVAGVIDNVGGSLLTAAFGLLEAGGLALAVGSSAEEPFTLDLEAERRRAGGTRLEIMTRGGGGGADLALLLGLMASGDLDGPIGWRGSWDRATEAVDALLGRRVAGKVVLDLA